MRRIVKPNQQTDLAPYKIATKLQVQQDFPAQNAFVNDQHRYIAAQCSRRAGKSNGLAFRFYKTMESHPKCNCIYLALTRDSAKQIMWPVLQEIDEKYKLNCVFKESDLSVTYPNGSRLTLYGADMPNFIRRLKGQKSPGIGIDEAQDFGGHLESLLNDVLTPMLVDYTDSWMAVVGTPGPVPQGYYFDMTHNGKYNYSVHKWTLLDNPYVPNPEAFINDLIIRNEWKANHPTLLREWRNQWVLDTESLWIRYNDKLNDYQELPTGHDWQYIMGVDIGYRDADAIAILAWANTTPNIYMVEEVLTEKQALTELVDQMNLMHKKYSPINKVVMDEGGIGKKFAEEIRRRHSINVEPADKLRKQENVEFLNDYMRLGKFKAKSDTRFVADSYLIQIDWSKSKPNKVVIKSQPHSDIIDAVLYAFKESYAFAYQPPEPAKPKWGTKEWAEAQDASMFEKEMEGHKQADNYSKWLRGEEEN